jgi:hypothetical protein
MRAAAVRFVGLLAAIGLGTLVLSILAGLMTGSTVGRSVSVGFYLVGSMLLLFGFFVANRGPVRTKDDSTSTLFGPLTRSGMLRWASADEVGDSLNMSAIFVALGIVLIFLGAATDTRYPLF